MKEDVALCVPDRQRFARWATRWRCISIQAPGWASFQTCYSKETSVNFYRESYSDSAISFVFVNTLSLTKVHSLRIKCSTLNMLNYPSNPIPSLGPSKDSKKTVGAKGLAFPSTSRHLEFPSLPSFPPTSSFSQPYYSKVARALHLSFGGPTLFIGCLPDPTCCPLP